MADAADWSETRTAASRARILIAAGFAIVSAFLFAVSNVALRMAGDAGAFEVALIRGVVYALALAPFIPASLARNATASPRRTLVVLALFTGFTFLTVVTWFLALHELTLATASSLFSLKAQFTMLCAVWILGERLSTRRVAAVLVGFLGGAILLNPGQPSIAGGLWALIAAASSAISGVLYAQLVREQSTVRVLLISSLVQALVLAPAFAADVAALPSMTLLMVAVNAAVSIGVMYTLARAYRDADVGMIASLELLRLPFAAGLGFAFFAERPTLSFFVGSAIIVFGTTLTEFRRAAHCASTRPVQSRLRTRRFR